MADPPISLVRSAVNDDLVSELESLLAEAREGKFVGALVFQFAELPRTTTHTICGKVNQATAMFAVERWKYLHLRDDCS